MKKTKKIIKSVETIQTQDIICNKCGESCKIGNIGETGNQKNLDWDIYGGLIESEIFGGYYSSKLDDQSKYTFSLCEHCLVKMFKNFKVPVDVEIKHNNN